MLSGVGGLICVGICSRQLCCNYSTSGIPSPFINQVLVYGSHSPLHSVPKKFMYPTGDDFGCTTHIGSLNEARTKGAEVGSCSIPARSSKGKTARKPMWSTTRHSLKRASSTNGIGWRKRVEKFSECTIRERMMPADISRTRKDD